MWILDIAIEIVFGTLVGGAALYLGAKVTRDNVILKEAVVIAFASSLCSLVPFAGPLIGWIVMLMLLSRWCGCEVWPSGILLSVIASIVQWFLVWVAVAVAYMLVTLFFGSHIEEESALFQLFHEAAALV